MIRERRQFAPKRKSNDGNEEEVDFFVNELGPWISSPKILLLGDCVTIRKVDAEGIAPDMLLFLSHSLR